MGTTANYLLPYPESGDAADAPTQMQALAVAVDTKVKAIDDRVGNVGWVGEVIRSSPVTAITTVDTICDTLTFTWIAGTRYKVTATGVWASSVADDLAQVRLRYQSGSTLTVAASTALTGSRLNADVANKSNPYILIRTLVAPFSGSGTVALTAIRYSGTGGIVMQGGADYPAVLIVEAVG